MSALFQSPLWLLLLPLAALPWMLRSARFDARHALLRSLCVALIVLGLARPKLELEDRGEVAVFVVDDSESVDSAERKRAQAAARAAIEALPSHVERSVVVLGSGEAFRDERTKRLQGSSLSAALESAAMEIPHGRRGSITILSDGASTDRHFDDACSDLQERGIPVHVVKIPPARMAARPASITCGQDLRAGHSAAIRVELVGFGENVRVLLEGPSGELASADGIRCDGNTVVSLEIEPPAPGFLKLKARASSATETVEAAFGVHSPFEVLYLGGRSSGGAARVAAALGAGFHLQERAATDGPESLPIQQFDLVMIDDAPAAALPDELESALVAAVRDRGVGLFASGGEAAFGPGGWAESPIAAALPVECIQKEEKRDPSTTLVVIIDTSGSMGGERIQLAKEVARLSMGRLLPHDKVGIVEFYGAKRWAAPIQPASNTIDLQRAINRMDAGGGTVILPAIEESFYGLQNVQTRYKHVLILTDGGVENGAFEPLLRRMAEEGIAVSTVLVGAEAHSEFLVNLANWGKGRFYSVPDRFNLPEILLKQPSSSRLPAYKPGKFNITARGGRGWWGAIDRTKLSEVAGYVETTPVPGAEVLLEIGTTRDPLLATRMFGAGRSTALMTEPAGPGTEPWRSTPEYSQMLSRVLARTAGEGRAPFALEVERRRGDVLLRAVRRGAGMERPLAKLLGIGSAPPSELPMEEIAPGIFEGRVFVGDSTDALFEVSAAGEGRRGIQRAASAARADQLPELAVPEDLGLDLDRLAAATKGDILQIEGLSVRAPRAGGPQQPRTVLQLASIAWILAILVFLAEVFYRRRDVLDAGASL